MKRVILGLLSLAVMVSFTSGLAIAQTANQDIKKACAEFNDQNGTTESPLCEGYKDGTAGTEDNNPILNTLTVVINILSFVAGVLAVFFVMFGGFKYITSAGDAGKVTSAKNTILYALVGLVIVAISRQLILFILIKVL